MTLLLDPLGSGPSRLLRRAVLDLAEHEHRHHFPAVLHVGTPGGPTVTVVDDPDLDHGLRTDLVGSALRHLRDPKWVWLTRSGPPCFQDPEAEWLGPAVAAAEERGVEVAFVVVTRHGWIDPRSGAHREWKRIRQRSRVPVHESSA